jgi:hypothetical protein
MGFRTVVILNNDRAHEWEYDANLGRLISADMHRSKYARRTLESSGYGRVVEYTHADTQTLAVIDSLQFVPEAKPEPKPQTEKSTVMQQGRSSGNQPQPTW